MHGGRPKSALVGSPATREDGMTRKEREREAYLKRESARRAEEEEQRSLRRANALDRYARRLDETGRDSDEEFGDE